MYEEVFRHILLPSYEKILGRRSSNRYISEYESQQWLSRDNLQLLQLDKLKQLVAYAYKHVKYYNVLWDQLDFHPNDLTELSVYEQLPFLTKDVIKENYFDLIADPLRATNLKKKTGGSTGVPLSFEYTEESYIRRNAVMWRGYSWANMRPGRKSTYLWGTNIGHNSLLNELKEHFYHKAYGRQMLSCFEMDDDKIKEYVERINKRKPEVIVSYVNPIYMLAKWIKDRGVNVHSPSSIVTGAEPLYDFQRNMIEAVFNTSVFNTYGSREFMLMASECDEHNGLHMNIDHLVIETVNANGIQVKGEIGEVVVTDLHNYGMPFIRYKNEDLAIINNQVCKCGRGLPVMDKIVGRTLDCIQTIDGRVLPGEFFPHFLKDFSGLEKFQVIQNTIFDLEIKLIVNDEFSAQDLEKIEAETKKILGNDINLQLNIVDDIPLTSSGKRRVTISNIHQSH